MPSIHDFEPLWGSWRIKRELGRGSFGGVYLAYREDAPEFESAIKHVSIPADEAESRALISDGVIADETGVRAYYDALKDDIISEIRFMYALRGNANIVAYEDHAVIPKKSGCGYDIFIRMELLKSLAEQSAGRQTTPIDVRRLGIDICTALEALEKHRIIHRDVKPANILVSPDGVYKLADFGVARQMERTCMVMSKKGTYAYMSPEVYRGAAADATSDLYSLGLVMYRLMNGNRSPFLCEDGEISYRDMELALAKRLAGRELPPPRYADEALCAVIRRATAFLPAERYAGAADMRAALERISQTPAAEVCAAHASAAAEPDVSTPRGGRIKTIMENEAELSASLRRKYAETEKKKTDRLVHAATLLCAAVMVFTALILMIARM